MRTPSLRFSAAIRIRGINPYVDVSQRRAGQLRKQWRKPMFSAALRGAPRAKASWSRLTPSRNKEILRYFAHLRSEAARRQNLTRAVAVLSGTTARFMGRDWSEGE